MISRFRQQQKPRVDLIRTQGLLGIPDVVSSIHPPWLTWRWPLLCPPLAILLPQRLPALIPPILTPAS